MTPNTQHIEERPPIVAVLGHVDHGKSTLLDYIRKANTVAKEAGGITQHVAAYEVVHEREGAKKRITFIDTPGHAAFQAIRARGAKLADIAILVVAADDGVKAQTLEALQSIKAANTPFIVAINKIDKPNADLARTQASLMEKEVYLEKLGGDVPWVAISAKTGQGVDELLDLILIVAELSEWKADTKTSARGYVVEAHRDAKRGIAATLIITEGVLESGQAVLAGRSIAPVRIMEDHVGKTLKKASFSSPVVLVGFDELPQVGAAFTSFDSKKEAEAAREKLPPEKSVSGDMPEGENEDTFRLPIIVRADTTGSLEAILHELKKIGTERSSIRIVQSGIGAVTEDDVKTAIASKGVKALVIGFNTSVDAIARERARQGDISIETFDIIYKLTERLEECMLEMRPKKEMETLLGKSRILKVFSSKKTVHLIGGRVTTGFIEVGASIRIMRKGDVLGVGTIHNIQSHKQNVNRVSEGSEFGAEVEADVSFSENDVLECFSTKLE